jgi:gliding motility-associated-like protein
MQTDVFLDFIDLSFYTGENLMSKVDGYAALMNKAAFTFPVGNEEKLRPLTIESVAINPLAKCAYFFEDPNSPSTFTTIFDTSITASTYLTVSEVEFWHLEGDIPSNVTLSWDSWSNTESLAELVTDLRVVGWSNTSNQWVDLGSTAHTGEMNFGTVTSDLFVPNEYDIITLGGNDDMQENFDMIALGNYLLTPNGDGLNDVLTIEGIEVSTNNVLQIYNRYGLLVYKKENYNNEFDGYSNVELVIKRRSGLPSGIYFYVITFYDLRQKHQGYMYISD